MYLYFNQQLGVNLVEHQLAAMFYRLSHYIIKETVGPQNNAGCFGTARNPVLSIIHYSCQLYELTFTIHVWSHSYNGWNRMNLMTKGHGVSCFGVCNYSSRLKDLIICSWLEVFDLSRVSIRVNPCIYGIWPIQCIRC